MKEYTFKIDGTEYKVSVEETENGKANVVVNGMAHSIEMEKKQAPPPMPTIKKTSPKPTQPTEQPKVKSDKEYAIKAPLPGIILDVFVKEGDSIKAGQKIILLEAMKMENNIDSDREGIVKQIKVQKGDSVYEGDVLILIN